MQIQVTKWDSSWATLVPLADHALSLQRVITSICRNAGEKEIKAMTKKNLNTLSLIAAATVLVSFVAVGAVNAQSGQSRGQAPLQQTEDVNVVNTPKVKIADAPGRKVLQTGLINFNVPGYKNGIQSIVTVPANQRLIIEYVSGGCTGLTPGRAYLRSGPMGQAPKGWLALPFINNGISAPVRFVVDPGDEVVFWIDNQSVYAENCGMTAAGYYVPVP